MFLCFVVFVGARRLVEGIPTLDFFSFVMVDRGPGLDVPLPDVGDFETSPPGEANVTVGDDNFTIPPGHWVSAEVNLSALDLIYTQLELVCNGDGESADHVCAVRVNDAVNVQTKVGGTVTEIVKNTDSGIRYLVVTMENNGETGDAVFTLPNITLSRSGRWTDIEGISSEPVENHNKALVYTMPISPEYGEIELETIRLQDPHPFPEFMLPINEEFGASGIPFTNFPILASASTIIGVNILNAEFLDLWSVVNYSESGEWCFGMRIKANRPFIISYTVIDTSSVSLMDALEIWHHSFPSTYEVQDLGNGAWILRAQSNPLVCSIPYNEKFEWGNGTNGKYASLLPFYPVSPLSVTIPVSPDQLEGCGGSQVPEVQAGCEVVKDAGQLNEKKEYVYTQNGSNYAYQLGWSSKVANYVVTNVISSEGITGYYDGLALSFYETDSVSYRIHSEDFYSVCDETGQCLVPILASMFPFAVNLTSVAPKGSLILGSWIHPQLLWSVASAGMKVELAKTGESYQYTDDVRRRLWGLRYMLGSRPMTIIETSSVVNLLDNLNEFCSICMILGAFPSLDLDPSSWEKCTLLKELNDVFGKWEPTMATVMRETTYFPNMDGIVTVTYNTPPETNASFYETSMFCPSDDDGVSQVTCYVSILLADRDAATKADGNMSVKLTFHGNENPQCALVPDGTACTASGHDVDVVMQGALLRTVTMSYVRNVDRSVETWVKENIWLLLFVFIVVLALLIAMGFAIWCMFCRKRSHHEHLARIIAYERKQKRKKARLEKEREELRNGRLRIEMSDSGSIELTP